jgi:hypothetical protein
MKWTFFKDGLGKWRWRRSEANAACAAESQLAFKHLLDCVKDAQANGYNPAEHPLDVEQNQ